MDIGAYIQIEDLQSVAEANGILVDRLRGYRLMKDEKPMTQETLEKWKRDIEMEAVEHATSAYPLCAIQPRGYSCEYLQRQRMERFVEELPDGSVRIRWDRIHGRMRKAVKYHRKVQLRAAIEQHRLWNQFAGRDDVLYIHSRDGRNLCRYTDEPWYLGGCLDWFDATYCDIYAKLQITRMSEDVS